MGVYCSGLSSLRGRVHAMCTCACVSLHVFDHGSDLCFSYYQDGKMLSLECVYMRANTHAWARTHSPIQCECKNHVRRPQWPPCCCHLTPLMPVWPGQALASRPDWLTQYAHLQSTQSKSWGHIEWQTNAGDNMPNKAQRLHTHTGCGGQERFCCFGLWRSEKLTN